MKDHCRGQKSTGGHRRAMVGCFGEFSARCIAGVGLGMHGPRAGQGSPGQAAGARCDGSRAYSAARGLRRRQQPGVVTGKSSSPCGEWCSQQGSQSRLTSPSVDAAEIARPRPNRHMMAPGVPVHSVSPARGGAAYHSTKPIWRGRAGAGEGQCSGRPHSLAQTPWLGMQEEEGWAGWT
jgi:hypothetical protein